MTGTAAALHDLAVLTLAAWIMAGLVVLVAAGALAQAITDARKRWGRPS